MRIAMFTNTFTPHVGGVARSVASFTAEHSRRGHRVLVVAPIFDPCPAQERDVVRVPAIQHFSDGDFSLPVPVPRRLSAALDRFAPDLIHSHHPFLLGSSALRAAAHRALPLVFTHHTLYEQYTHYMPGDSPAMRRAAVDQAAGYCNLCDAVIAPSESVQRLLRRRGVTVPTEAIATGVDIGLFAAGRGEQVRQRFGIPPQALVVGHVGRLAPEKNLGFLIRAVSRFLAQNRRAHALVAGDGLSKGEIRRLAREAGVGERLHLAGVYEDQGELADVYAAMDVFAFASHSETQGMVLAEAMAAGVPVVAVDASGVREVVRDAYNGRLLEANDEAAFAEALDELTSLPDASRRAMIDGARATARRFSLEATAARSRQLYGRLLTAPDRPRPAGSVWQAARRSFVEQLKIWRNFSHAAVGSLLT